MSSVAPDRKTIERAERRRILVALLASLLFHLFLILVVALVVTLHLVPPAPPKPPEEPAELTLVAPPPPKQQKPAYMTTTEAQRSEKAPDHPAFESDKNTLAAAEKTAGAAAPVPTQEGEKSPSLEFENRDYTSGREPRPASPAAPPPQPQQNTPPPPQPTPQPTSTPKPQPTATPKMTPRQTGQLALLEPPPPKQQPHPAQTPRPEQKQNPRPPQPETQPSNPSAPGFQPQTRITRIEGNISNRGRASVAALGTPLGRYKKQVSDAIGSRWYYYVNEQLSVLTPGTVHVSFIVRPDGQVQRVNVLSNTSNESFAACSVRAIMEAEIPPIPKELVPMLDGSRIEIDYSFTILAN